MIDDINLFGIFLNGGLATAAVAAALLLLLRRVLSRLGVYRLVWHPALVDLALFLVLWFGVSLSGAHLRDSALFLLG